MARPWCSRNAWPQKNGMGQFGDSLAPGARTIRMCSLDGRSWNPQTAPCQRRKALVGRAQFKERLRPRFGKGVRKRIGDQHALVQASRIFKTLAASELTPHASTRR